MKKKFNAFAYIITGVAFMISWYLLSTEGYREAMNYLKWGIFVFALAMMGYGVFLLLGKSKAQ